MVRETELDVLLKNRPGAFAEVCELFGNEKINIRAFTLTSGGVLQVLVDDLKKARAVLKEKHFPFQETEVLTLECLDRPGEMAKVCGKLAKENINIDFGFCSGNKQDKSLVVFDVDDMEKAMEILH
ncbi:MAG: ACT domain-containing protein [Elusimicrobiota bacterium]